MSERDPHRHRRRDVLDLQTVFLALLIGSFVLIGVTIGYGLVTKTLKPEVALAVGSTLFSGVLAGILAGGRNKPPPGPPPEEADR